MTRLLGLLTAALCSASSATAQQTFTVDRLTDTGEGEGLAGDLRYCITNAADGDSITFAVTGTINLTRALPELTQGISIEGPGANRLIVSGGGRYRVFMVSGTVVLSGLTIYGGRDATRCAGISNSGMLTISNSTIAHNTAGERYNPLGPKTGGGICNYGILNITRSTISDNLVFASAGDSVHAYGGGIHNSDGAALTVTDSTISGNSATSTYYCDQFGCDFLDEAHGGGIYNSGTLVIVNSTITGNVSSGDIADGGGVSTAGSTSISNSTITNNSLSEGYFIYYCGYGGGGGISGSVRMSNTILAGNHRHPFCLSGHDLLGTLSLSGHNLIGDTRGVSGYDETDLLNVDPMLGPLQDNGGPTLTHALLPGSPAIDAGDPDFIGPPDFDQRGEGFPRIVNKIVDIGAFEFQGNER